MNPLYQPLHDQVQHQFTSKSPPLTSTNSIKGSLQPIYLNLKKSPQPADLVKKQDHQLVEFLQWNPALEVRWIQLSRPIFGACGDKNPHLETNEQQVKIPIPLKKSVEVDTNFSWNLGGVKTRPVFFFVRLVKLREGHVLDSTRKNLHPIQYIKDVLASYTM